MIKPKKMQFIGLRNIENVPQVESLTKEQLFDLKVVGSVLPFRVNNYVIDELIDWDNIPDDPIFQLTFMQKGMLTEDQYNRMADVILKNEDLHIIKQTAEEIRFELNPHPAGQMNLNVPILDGHPVPGIQHKYKETVLVFPSSGQTCHAYCTFCFRWAQFVGLNDLKFATDESKKFQEYIKSNKDITDVLFTGGDPMVMSAKNFAAYIEPLLDPEFEHVQNIRIGTKSISYWPYKYLTDNDCDELLELFSKVVKAGKHLALMAHFNHWLELKTDSAKEAIKKIRSTGVEIRTQSPLIKYVNDDPDIWANMWKEQVKLGCIPYYFFIERNTGAKKYFEIPLYKAYEIYTKAYKQVSGLCRTARGPSMSALPGKVTIEGMTEINNQKLFVLTLLQARNPEWTKQPFFAKYSETAKWLNDLRPAFGEDKFFYQDELNKMIRASQGKMYFDVENNESSMVDIFEQDDDELM